MNLITRNYIQEYRFIIGEYTDFHFWVKRDDYFKPGFVIETYICEVETFYPWENPEPGYGWSFVLTQLHRVYDEYAYRNPKTEI